MSDACVRCGDDATEEFWLKEQSVAYLRESADVDGGCWVPVCADCESALRDVADFDDGTVEIADGTTYRERFQAVLDEMDVGRVLQ
ncbi:hypothetical protein [Haloarchaeobius sp. DFWS5]|uniref:hypothetical protein n=1 Tax=Haloarchaeobius sp. DFWS5 TaxID=3446114 RepID=UPI003EB9E7F0